MLNGALFESSLLDGIRQIEVAVDIDEYGRVTAARSLSTNEDVSPLVSAAAVTAAKQWVFEPARIGHNNVAAKHTIVFRFAQR
jgi:outer membrane biosynthesis protein TonB